MRRATKETGSERPHIETIRCGGCKSYSSLLMACGRESPSWHMSYGSSAGGAEGYALQDWLDAEAMVREDLYEARQ